MNEDFLVSSFIDYDQGCYKIGLLEGIFLPCDVEQILGIPICNFFPNDQLVWHYSRSGHFSVKSAYHLIVDCGFHRVNMLVGVPSASRGNWPVHFIWSLRLPSKIKVFFWVVKRDILPTQCNLGQRRISVDADCLLCDDPTKTKSHIFFDFPVAMDVWKLYGFTHYYEDVVTFKEWIFGIQSQLQADQQCLFFVLLWSLWYNRNKV